MVVKISRCDNFNIKNRNYKNVSFKAGKVELFSDFDKTYFPPSGEGLKRMSPNTHPGFTQYCDKFRNFLNNTREGLKFHVTTGRTFGEYQTISELVRERGFELPLPDTFIAKNGSDEYIKIGTDEDFYKKGIFPFRYDKTNVEKEKKLKELTGWDGPKIRAKIEKILNEHDFRIVYGDSEHGTHDYGSKSLFYGAKLPYETERISGMDNFERVAGFRNDGNCKIFVTYPPDMQDNTERNVVLEKIKNELNKHKPEQKAVYDSSFSQKPNECGGRLCQVIEPMPNDLVGKTPKNRYEGLTKLFDAKEAVQKAIKNNDLVIVAGDSGNDFTMLNPLYYIETPPEVNDDKIKDKVLQFWNSNLSAPSDITNKLDRNNPIHKRIAEQIDDLPLMGVIVNSGDDNKLDSIESAFNRNNQFEKVVAVQPGELEDGVKEAVRLYCKKHPDYAEKLSPDLKQEIFGTTGDISEFLTDTAPSFLPTSNQAEKLKDQASSAIQNNKQVEQLKEKTSSVIQNNNQVEKLKNNDAKFIDRLKSDISSFKKEVKNLKKDINEYKDIVKKITGNDVDDDGLSCAQKKYKLKIKEHLKNLKNNPLTKKMAIAALVLVGTISTIFAVKKIHSKKQIKPASTFLPQNFNVPECFADFLKV